jgi:hypothetical protein
MMRMLDFFFYHIRPFGIHDQRPATPGPPPDLNLTATPWFAPKETTAAGKTTNQILSNTSTAVIASANVNNITTTTSALLPNATANSMLPAVTQL